MLALTYCSDVLRGGQEVPRPTKNKGGPRLCWPYVGVFFAPGRLFFALGRFVGASGTFFAHFDRFFRVLGRSELDFGWSGAGFGAFKTTFLAACWCQQAHVTEMLFMQQNHSFCDVL